MGTRPASPLPGGKFLLSSKYATLTQKETGGERWQAPRRVGGGVTCAGADPGTPGVPPTLGQTPGPQGFPPTPGHSPSPGSPAWLVHGPRSCPGQVLPCLPAEKTLPPQVMWGTQGHSWVGFSWPAPKPSGFDLLPQDTPQQPPLPFNPPCAFHLSLQARLTLTAGRLGKTPS